jgi:Spaetzle
LRKHLISIDFSCSNFSQSGNAEITKKIFLLIGIIFVIGQTTRAKYRGNIPITENDPNYPLDKLELLDLWKKNFGSSHRGQKVHPRMKRSFIAEAKLCESSISFKRPQKLRNTNNQLRTIVNHQNYTQIVRFETCGAENFPCTFEIYPNTARSFCNQTFSTVQLTAFDERRNCLTDERFSVPSGCDCMIDKADFLKGVKKDLLQAPRVHY